MLTRPIASAIAAGVSYATAGFNRLAAGVVAVIELVVNGTFDTGVDGWTAANSASLTWNAGRCRISHTTVSNPYARQTVTVEIGKTYRFRCNTYANGLSNVVRLGATPGSGTILNSQTATDQVIDFTFTAGQTPIYISILNFTAVGSGFIEIDNVSLQEVV